MYFRGTMKINNTGNLSIGGCDAVELAKEFGTPLYVFDEEGIRNNCRRLSYTLANQKLESRIIYAGKAFLTLAMCKIIQDEGLGLDVVSGGELYTAIHAGFPMDKICFHGNNKTFDELELALKADVGRVIVDNFNELEMLNAAAAHAGKKAHVHIRVTPGVSAHTHHYIQTGQEDSKFGFSLASGQAMKAIELARSLPHIVLRGFHCHIGSQIFSQDSFAVTINIMVGFMKKVMQDTGYLAEELNLGGGWGIRYTEEDTPMPLEKYVEELVSETIRCCEFYAVKAPKLIFEPGRAIIGEMGTTLYTVGALKEVVGNKHYLAVDGGMGDNPRYALYQAQYEAALVNKLNEPDTTDYCVVGKCCESGDIIIEKATLPEAQAGDTLAVFCTGAYNYSMSSNYNRIARPAAVLVDNGEAHLIVKRETYADLMRNDMLPAHLGNVKDLDMAL